MSPSEEAPFAMLMQAESFSNASTVLLKAMRSEESAPRYRQGLAVPLAVNLAFALEIYFKCLIVLEKGKSKHVHDLKSLFDNLQKPTQVRLESEFIDVRKQFPSANMSATLAECLDAGKDYFENERYFWENGQTNYSNYFFNLQPLVLILRKIILELKPHWTQMAELPENLPKLKFSVEPGI